VTSATPDLRDDAERLHGGRLIARRLRAHGVSTVFTLSGGHLFSIYDGCRAEGTELVDVRHEQTAAFAAEGWAKGTRSAGVCAVTAGPGVTNAISAIASAAASNSPVLVLGGRAPQFRWGQGSLQELARPHVPRLPARSRRQRGRGAPASARAPSVRGVEWARRRPASVVAACLPITSCASRERGARG